MEQRPTIRALEYLVAVADAGHFGRAARRCAVSQPALSASIAGLEDLLGVVIFERSRRGARVTRAGEPLVARARAVLRAADELIEAARAARGPLAGPLHLGVIPTVAPFVLPRWLPAVHTAHPDLQLFLHEDRTERVLAGLRDGALDLLLLALPVDGEGLEQLPVADEPFVLALPAAHPLARARGPVREAELAHEHLLLLEDGHCLRDQALDVCHRAGASEAGEVRATSLATLTEMVAGGLGATLLPASGVAALTGGRDEIVLRRFRAPAPGRTLGLVWRRSSPRAEDFRALADGLRRRIAPRGTVRASIG